MSLKWLKKSRWNVMRLPVLTDWKPFVTFIQSFTVNWYEQRSLEERMSWHVTVVTHVLRNSEIFIVKSVVIMKTGFTTFFGRRKRKWYSGCSVFIYFWLCTLCSVMTILTLRCAEVLRLYRNIEVCTQMYKCYVRNQTTYNTVCVSFT